jgi:beta-glucuronidase
MTKTLSNVAVAVTAALLALAPLEARDQIDLGGNWRFAVDPQKRGEANGWNAKVSDSDWTQVTVPHCWPVDPRYQYTGPAWYRRAFPTPPYLTGRHARLVFEGVFYHAAVWLNGRLVGEHEGGYTEFEFDVTRFLTPGGENQLAVRVDNSWSDETIPASRPGPRAADQVYPWWNYGGIVRPLRLEIGAPVYISRQRAIAVPESGDGSTRLSSTVWIRNTSAAAAQVTVSQAPEIETGALAMPDLGLRRSVTVPPQGTVAVDFAARMPRASVRLWDQDHPVLYRMRTSLSEAGGRGEIDSHTATFGIRKVETRGRQLLLNGEPIRMGGGNRHSDHPKYGLIEPAEVIDLDMTLMKNGGMELSRISHYPVSAAVLDWADRHGLLIIEECSNWGFTATQMDSPAMRTKFQRQLREIVERDWNHPSVIGWSVGNEYSSDQPAGVRWTKDMAAFVRELDPSRLTTLASNHAAGTGFTRPEEEGSHWVDLICVNIYGNMARVEADLDRVHQRWPDRVFLVSEFGSLPANTYPAEARADYIRRFAEVIRRRPYIAGASIWSFNDYRSRYPGTADDGYRHLGAVTADRKPTAMYHALSEEFSPALIESARQTAGKGAASFDVTVAARADFPAYTLRNYRVRCSWLESGRAVRTAEAPLPVLAPGASATVTCATQQPPSSWNAPVRVEVVRPTGHTTVGVTVPAR